MALRMKRIAEDRAREVSLADSSPAAAKNMNAAICNRVSVVRRLYLDSAAAAANAGTVANVAAKVRWPRIQAAVRRSLVGCLPVVARLLSDSLCVQVAKRYLAVANESKWLAWVVIGTCYRRWVRVWPL